MRRDHWSELPSLLLVVFTAATYTLAVAVLTILAAPSPNVWWIDQWSAPLALAASLSVFLIASVSRWLFFVLVNLSLCLTALAGYFIGQTGVILDYNTMAAVLETTTPEAGEFVSAKLAVTVLLAVLLGLAVTTAYVKSYRPTVRGISLRATVAAIVLVLIAVTVPKPLMASVNVFMPAKLGMSAYAYYSSRESLERRLRHRFDIATLPSSIESTTSDDFALVLVIGESARSDHFALNGYYRDTNAYTEKERGLVNFRDVMSCDTLTRVSVPCLLTRATLSNKDLRTRETSLLDLAKKHGFNVTWISMNDVYGMNNLPTSVIANSADEKIFRFGVNYQESNDLYLLPHFHKVVEKRASGRQLIVVHLRGSHYDYAQRYPTGFGVFKPDGGCEKSDCTINAYDNSILFTDYVLSRFIDDIRGREALLFYVSDHGESLGESDERGQVFWKHGQNYRREQRIVPMQVWASDRFIAKHPDRFAALGRRSAAALSHDHFFHSVLDCSGIHSEAVDKGLSLCTQGSFTEREETLPGDDPDAVNVVFRAQPGRPN